MAIGVHTNYASIVAQNTLNSTNNALTKSMERLSTGLRINSAADDAAGLQIASRLEMQTRGQGVAQRNAQDAISMMQTAEGALDEATNIAYRMNDLALQAANGSNSAEDLAALQSEFGALNDELASVMSSTSFGGQALLKGGGFGAGAISFQVGTTATDVLSVDVSTELGALDTAIGAAGGNTLGDLTTGAGAAVTGISGAGGLLEQLGTVRSAFGANINRLEHTITNLGNMSENLSASKGRITDVDFAKESGEMSKNQMLMQSGAQMLSATKMVPQLAMSLLG
ncbi:flagellin N-terminal helical domain-containing protein [Vibrio mediterranei]|uniref:flagellin N-terminal helical domain-containing protein n=1 Tax=Vibrio mediterranei TaxID=689 RepID=UPI004068EABB